MRVTSRDGKVRRLGTIIEEGEFHAGWAVQFDGHPYPGMYPEEMMEPAPEGEGLTNTLLHYKGVPIVTDEDVPVATRGWPVMPVTPQPKKTPPATEMVMPKRCPHTTYRGVCATCRNNAILRMRAQREGEKS